MAQALFPEVKQYMSQNLNFLFFKMFTATRGVHHLLQIQIHVSVLKYGWVTLRPLSVKVSTRGVY